MDLRIVFDCKRCDIALHRSYNHEKKNQSHLINHDYTAKKLPPILLDSWFLLSIPATTISYQFDNILTDDKKYQEIVEKFS